MAEYQKGDAYNLLKREFENGVSHYQVEIAKTLAIVDALNDLEGHLAEQLFYGTSKRA